MDLQRSCTSPLPWIWAVETLAKSNQIDTSILLDLYEKTPEISDDLGRNAREVVSLKILERFLVEGTSGHSLSPPSGEKIKLDPSDSCEDVLRRIVPQATISSLKDADLDVSRWDLLPFIHGKRSSLAKYTLQQLKDAILAGNSSLTSLKEQSSLGIGNQPENGTKMNGGNCNITAPGLDSPSTNLLSVCQKRRFASENAGGSSCENQIPPVNQSIKKHKHGQKADIEKSKGKGQEAVSISSDTEGRNEDGTSIATKENAPLRHQHALGSLETTNCRDQNCIADEVLAPSEFPTDGHGEVLFREEQAEMPIDNFDGGDKQEHEVELNKLGQTIPKNIQNAGVAEGVNISSFNDEFHDEETSIGTMKKTFLSSQCTYSHDSLATTDWGELNLCMKCSKDGKLLVCSSDSCPLVIHVTCLRSDASYDQSGKFYCPFCAYSQAISNYTKAKKMVSLARKDLATFICIRDQNILEGQSLRSRPIKQNHLEPDDGLHRSNKVRRDVASKVLDPQKMKQPENEQAGCSPSRISKGEAIAAINRTAHGLDEDKQTGKITGKVSRSLRFLGKQEMDEQAKQKSPPGNTSPQDSKRNDAYESRANTRSKKQKTVLPNDQKHLSRSQSVDLEQTSEDENEIESSGAKHFTRVQKPKMNSSFPAIPHMRRNKLRWTKAEENILKEGVRLLSNPNDSTMPWTKILEFGADVFDKSRTTVDLKDKWRNLCKASRKS